MAILVSGGAGYIGSHVVAMLVEEEYEVIVFDNLSAGHRAAVPDEVTFVEGDLLHKADLEALFDAYPSIEGIMHFASHILVGESMQKPFKYFHDNVLSVLNLLEVASDHDVRRFILSSTANLFDNPGTIPISEDEPLIPGSVYAETKFWAERVLHWMDTIYDMKYCALRYFNACGAHPNGHIGEDHDPESHLIPLVLQVALGQRDQISIFGTDYDTPDGTCIRDYVHVLDLASAHLLAYEALKDGESRVYNLGSGTGYSVLEVIETARQVTGHPIPAEKGARRPGDLPVLVADSTRIRRDLGWSPEFNNLYQIIQTAWNWHQAHPHGFDSVT